MASLMLDTKTTLPADGATGALAGRIWRPDQNGPSVVAIRQDGISVGVFDLSASYPTMRDLCEQKDPARALAEAGGAFVATLDDILANTPADGRDESRPWLLSPVDLQAVKA